MFGKRKESGYAYDPKEKRPVIKCSICNGEQVAGFKDLKTGHFEEIMFISGNEDLYEFKRKYGIEGEIPKEY
jgi:hypothetical protein